MSVPGGPGADLVLVQSNLTLGRLEAGLDGPSCSRDVHQRADGRVFGGEGQVIGQLVRFGDGPTDQQGVLSSQWQGEFCRCSIDVVGGKQCDGRVDHVERFRHHTGPSPKAGKPMAQPAVDPLNRHRFILADIVPPNRQEGVVRRIIVRTVQRDAPGFQPLQQPVQRGGITIATFPVDEAERSKANQIHSLFFFFEGNARARPVPSQPRSRPALVEGAARALPHEPGSNSELRGSKRRVA